MKMHASITLDRIMDGVERSEFDLDNAGFCLKCGEDADGCEPDARAYPCEMCGERAVYGAQEVLIMVHP